MTSRYPEKEAAVKARYERLSPTLNERERRLFAANEAVGFGFGGVAAVHRATRLAPSTIRRGIQELWERESNSPTSERQRAPGGGRKKVEEQNPTILGALRQLIEPATLGDPESALLWTSRSVRNLAEELGRQGYAVSPTTVRRLLRELGFTLQRTQKSRAGTQHEDRDAQFQYINTLVQRFQQSGQPVLSIDAKKKEMVGNYANGGAEWRTKGHPPEVQDHDFPNGVPKAVPYGVYDVVQNEGWVSVGVSHDTAEFAAATIRQWWDHLGRPRYSDATDLLITADCGGSNGYRIRLWRWELQQLADATGLTITVAHLPPGTSKWNKIEHRMFSFISINWRGKPLTSYQVIVDLIAATSTRGGLEISCMLDPTIYEKGRKISDEELASIDIERHTFHGEWNYTIYPRPQGDS